MGGPKQARAILTRNGILRSAGTVFAEKGFAGTTIAEILTHAGVTKGALYFHFASKEDLAAAIIAAQEQWLASVATTMDPQANPVQQWIDFSHAFVDAIQHDPVIRASVRLASEGNGLSAEQLGVFTTWIDACLPLATQAKRAGCLLPGWTALRLVRLVTASINGIQLSSMILTGHSDLRHHVQDFWQAVLPGIVTPETLSQLRTAPLRRRSSR